MDMRFVECPECGCKVDITAKKRSLKSLLCGESHLAFCEVCSGSFLFRFEGRVVLSSDD